MLVKTILNRIQKYSSFVYGDATLYEDKGNLTLDIPIAPRKNSRPICSKCGVDGPGYDHMPSSRRFEFIPIWGILVFFVYTMRRVDCPTCGVTIESVPWGDGKRQSTTTYSWFLAHFAKKMSWVEVAKTFNTSWANVYFAVEMAVEWGRKMLDLSDATAIGIDEILWHRGHKYLTVVYQISGATKRLLWVGQGRTVKTALKFFRWFGPELSGKLQFVASDMWKPYLKVIARKAGQATHVLDRYHIMAMMNKAIDKVRNAEAKKLQQQGREPVLKNGRWCLLKREENLTDKQNIKLAELLQYNLKTVRAYLLREDFQFFWSYVSPYWAGKFIDKWCTRTMRSKIEPMKKIARSLRKNRELILNWFRARGQISQGAVEGLNTKAKLAMRKSFGWRSFRCAEIALFHTLGNLPEPQFTHRFW